MGALSTHQVAHDDLGAGLHCQVQRGQLGGVLHARVDVGLHADQEQHALNVRVLHSHVQEIPTLVIHLWHKEHVKSFIIPLEQGGLCSWMCFH